MHPAALSLRLEHLCEGASEARIAALSARYRLDPEEVRGISAADPTPNGAYTAWLVRHAASGAYRFPEDADKAREQLARFHQLKAKSTYTGEKDVNKLDPGALYQLLQQHGDTVGRKEAGRIAAQKGVREAGRGGGFVVWEVTTPEAGAKLFRGTNWCVKDPKYFNEYGPPFYMVATEEGEPHALYHPDSGDFNDVEDRELEPGAGGEMKPALAAAGLLDGSLDEIADQVLSGPTALHVMALSQWSEQEIANTPAVFWYANHCGGRLSPQAEDDAIDQLCSDNVREAIAYAVRHHRRWPELEEDLLDRFRRRFLSAYDLAQYVPVLDGAPWPELTAALDHDARDTPRHLVPRHYPQYPALRPYFSPGLRAAAGL